MKLYIVGTGPGSIKQMTEAAHSASPPRYSAAPAAVGQLSSAGTVRNSGYSRMPAFAS